VNISGSFDLITYFSPAELEITTFVIPILVKVVNGLMKPLLYTEVIKESTFRLYKLRLTII